MKRYLRAELSDINKSINHVIIVKDLATFLSESSKISVPHTKIAHLCLCYEDIFLPT